MVFLCLLGGVTPQGNQASSNSVSRTQSSSAAGSSCNVPPLVQNNELLVLPAKKRQGSKVIAAKNFGKSAKLSIMVKTWMPSFKSSVLVTYTVLMAESLRFISACRSSNYLLPGFPTFARLETPTITSN
ncbi:hypothetical protein EV368DRAFT_68533 [Lentinula lateritia]|nr:hypothetical protein EV368DRAFT_68533 [Lentinula lateritia]